MREVGEGYRTRIVLCHADIEESAETVNELNKLCFIHNFTLILAWSHEELARYLESLHIYEGSSPIIQFSF